jgi:DNA polymerase-3 subunit epsilon
MVGMWKDLASELQKFGGNSLPNFRLDTVAERCGYELENHHDALEDAKACAAIALEIL